MSSDPIKTYYLYGYADATAGKRRRVPRNFKLAYVSGRYDAVCGKSSRYPVDVRQLT